MERATARNMMGKKIDKCESRGRWRKKESRMEHHAPRGNESFSYGCSTLRFASWIRGGFGAGAGEFVLKHVGRLSIAPGRTADFELGLNAGHISPIILLSNAHLLPPSCLSIAYLPLPL